MQEDITTNRLKTGYDLLDDVLHEYSTDSKAFATMIEAKRLLEAEARVLGADTNKWHDGRGIQRKIELGLYVAMTIVAVVFACMRLNGVKSEFFQAFAHLLVGGMLLGSAVEYKHTGRGFHARYLFFSGIALSILELLAFLISRHVI